MARRMLTVRLADELVETLKEKAEADAIPVTELVTRLLRRGLSNVDQPQAEGIAELQARLLELEGRLEQSTSDLESKLERTAGRFETLENLFARMIPAFSRNG
ncbi:MAG TPA: hypothetical protein IGS53_26550 [Leptolyngbyaceae cyanobacterium M33_DOE_097]|uniref:Ribbon-helix-helix protein, CopG family n=1 Tax=Oscillatoriales cyanobacterium SpSt-418 TaxID=2282169 RepID=A0A7C3KD72_9CYAN|nr:hypothetical protein [Leptolyngbyaceae cyanobacterium M33_DOE_097]